MFLQGDRAGRGDAGAGAVGGSIGVTEGRALPDILDGIERELILKAYEKAKHVKTETARLLGVKPSALYYKLEKYGIGTIDGREARGEGRDKGGATAVDEARAEALLGDGPDAGGSGTRASDPKPR
jgi:hypothetical protein